MVHVLNISFESVFVQQNRQYTPGTEANAY